MNKKAERPIIEGEISAMAFGGRGILKQNGKVYFVDDALPGDLVRAQVTKEKKSFGEAYSLEKLNENSQRRSSPCQYSNDCGGCQWLESKPNDQEQWKREFIEVAVKKFAKQDRKLSQFYRSPQELNYRNRVSLKGVSKQGKISLGYYKRRSHDLVRVDNCKIVESPINQAISDISTKAVTNKDQISFDLDLQVLKDQTVIAQATFPPRVSKKEQAIIIKAINSVEIISNTISGKKSQGNIYLYDQQNGIDYYTYQGQFQQVNIQGNHILRELVSEIVDDLEPKVILDLFCGSGNLSLHLCKADRQIVGVELNEASIATAKFNVEKNNLEGIEYHCTSSKAYLSSESAKSLKGELIIVDPPRRGLEGCVSDLIDMDAGHILYISCDPNTLARDIAQLLSAGYKLETLKGLDFFPNTYHVESVALLSK